MRIRLLQQARMEPNPVTYSQAWTRYEHTEAEQRARYYSGMRYRDFTKTKYYKATRVANEIYHYLTAILGIVIITSVFFGFMEQLENPRSSVAIYFMDLIIFIVGLVFIFFGLFQIIDVKTEKNK